ncbi:uncharacterized protein LOC125241747 [Leguminivora glycinivorella]|uniref:uncharacterized protein LOC125241747 n=1 Tax=Leguminivora glycinivorella TaxID=1035111 RepID=UPI00200C032B|nr:uncharacterized protein LOC125241747 [Leguminivora glycinivorella]
MNAADAAALLLFLALTVNIINGTKELSSAVSEQILEILGRQLSDIKSRADGYGASVPPYRDAITFETQHVDLCGPILCISANLTKGSITGVSEYEIIKSDVDSDGESLVIDIDIKFPKLQLDSDYYTMKGNIMDAIPLAGEGKLQFQITDLRIWTKIVLHLLDYTAIESIDNSGFSVNSILSRTEFDGNIDGVFNAMVEELLAEHLNRFNKAIAAQCGLIIKQLFNDMFNNL